MIVIEREKVEESRKKNDCGLPLREENRKIRIKKGKD